MKKLILCYWRILFILCIKITSGRLCLLRAKRQEMDVRKTKRTHKNPLSNFSSKPNFPRQENEHADNWRKKTKENTFEWKSVNERINVQEWNETKRNENDVVVVKKGAFVAREESRLWVLIKYYINFDRRSRMIGLESKKWDIRF